MNRSYCNSCQKLVPAEGVERDGRVFLVKNCPDCGQTETLVSNHARRYFAKQSLDGEHHYRGCALNCPTCRHADRPTYAFINITSRCNLNCPICVDGVPAIGFLFEPPLEYFDKIFRHLASSEPLPTIALFGGEPTVRKDLFDIIDLAQSYGLKTRILTNGLRLADEEFCRKLVATRTVILMSYDGSNPETYRVLRGTPKALQIKQRALETLARVSRTRHVRLSLIACFGWGLNEGELPELLKFCHGQRAFLRDLYLMPLTKTWDTSEWKYDPRRMTTEDVEQFVADAFPGYNVDFIPVGFVAGFKRVTRYVGQSSLPYKGAHPNCESMYLLISDGEKYVPIAHFLKGSGSLVEFSRAFKELEDRLAARENRWQTGLVGRVLGAVRLRRPVLALLGAMAVLRLLVRHVRLGRIFKGWGPLKLVHALMMPLEMALGCSGRKVMARHTNVQGHLQLIILPLEDDQIIETNRLERCPTAHAYYDPRADKVKYVPVCAWRLHNKGVMREIADYYAARTPSAC